MTRPCTVTGCPHTTRRGSGRCPEHRYADRGVRGTQEPPAETSARARAAESAVRDAFGGAVTAETSVFVSGAVALVLRHGSDVASVLGSSSGDGWHVADPSGREHAVVTTDAVVDVLRGYWPHTAGRQSGHGR